MDIENLNFIHRNKNATRHKHLFKKLLINLRVFEKLPSQADVRLLNKLTQDLISILFIKLLRYAFSFT